jgi:hypothetical protein
MEEERLLRAQLDEMLALLYDVTSDR